MGRAIFISYRRDDTAGEAGRLFDDLVRTFGDASVFMDVAGINPGIDFRKAIDDNVSTCGVLLAMIGPNWATIAGSSGERRLDDPNDFVRLEVAAALARNIAVIPVLVHDAKMPHPDQLPDALKDLAFRNSVEITHARWNSDVQLLTKALAQYITPSSATNTEPVHATVAVQLPPPNPPAGQPVASRGPKTKVLAAVGAAAVVVAAIGLFLMHGSNSAAPPAPTPTTTTPSNIDVAGGPLMGEWVLPEANALTGTSQDPSPPKAENELARLRIAGKKDEIKIHAWGSCRKCDWGSQVAALEGNSKATATWNFAALPDSGEKADSGRVARVTVTANGDKLSVLVENTFAKKGPNSRRSEFVRVTGP
ncbi:MAG: toll/interleukin-1 receptor domain-containing protein [Terracidiphilus sp.]